MPAVAAVLHPAAHASLRWVCAGVTRLAAAGTATRIVTMVAELDHADSALVTALARQNHARKEGVKYSVKCDATLAAHALQPRADRRDPA